MNSSVKEIIDNEQMARLQYATIIVCFFMNILDGMDVLVISYSASAIANSWAVGPEALGAVFSAGLAGMTIGALFMAPFADQIGRKKMILISAFVIGISMYLTAYTSSVSQLIVVRFLSGIGIGSMLASTTVLTSEFVPNRSKDFWVSFVLSGYPVGAVIAGVVAAYVIPEMGWQMMFKIAGLASFASIPLIYLFMAESVSYYVKKQPKNALAKANSILQKIGGETIDKLPLKEAKSTAIPVSKLLNVENRRPTLQLWTALFLSFGCLYFLISWIPKLAESTGLSMELSIYAGTVFNVGAFVGIITQGYFSSRFGLKNTVAIFFIITAMLMATFKLFIGSELILLVYGVLGFAIQGGFVGLYSVATRIYPTEFRTTGMGWAIGMGRLGGVLGPAVGGVLIGMGLTMASNFMIFAVPALLAGTVTFYMSSKKIS